MTKTEKKTLLKVAEKLGERNTFSCNMIDVMSGWSDLSGRYSRFYGADIYEAWLSDDSLYRRGYRELTYEEKQSLRILLVLMFREVGDL